MQEPPQRLVSVVMVNRDKAPYVGEAIQSVWEQGVGDLELLIVDNGVGNTLIDFSVHNAQAGRLLGLGRALTSRVHGLELLLSSP